MGGNRQGLFLNGRGTPEGVSGQKRGQCTMETPGDEHRGEDKGDEIFSMKMEKSFKKPLARQVREGVEIEMSKATLLNSKSECNNSKIPRIVIEEGEKLTEDRESGLGNQAEVEKGQRRQASRVEKSA